MGRGSSALAGGGGGAMVAGNVAENAQMLTEEQAEALRQQYESGFDDATKKSIQKYISAESMDNKSHSPSQVMNFLISRGENLDTITADEINAKYNLGITDKNVALMRKMNQNIDAAMHNLGVDALLERGAHSGQISQMFGVSDYTSMTPTQLSNAFVGKAFSNTAVWSTSYNTSKNPFLSSTSSQSGGREVIYRIKAGKNTQCVFGATNQAEIVLGKGTNFRVTGASFTGKIAHPKSGGSVKQIVLDIETF
mgnify:CR=1 FL=1